MANLPKDAAAVILLRSYQGHFIMQGELVKKQKDSGYKYIWRCKEFKR